MKERVRFGINPKTGIKFIIVDWSWWHSIGIEYSDNDDKSEALAACRRALAAAVE